MIASPAEIINEITANREYKVRIGFLIEVKNLKRSNKFNQNE